MSAPHVALADEAYLLGPAPAGESYLRGDLIIEAARKCGAEAIHPGYGFLSENAGFAEACEKAGVVFIGPPPEAIRAMGSKSAAKDIMSAAGVPLVPGYHGRDQDSAILSRAAEEIGYPVLIKASAGGGGKGMRVVHQASEFKAALRGQGRRLQLRDDQVLIEKYLARAPHRDPGVRRQLATRCSFERDCWQCRYQKVLRKRRPRRDRSGAARWALPRWPRPRRSATSAPAPWEFIADQGGAFTSWR